MPAFVDIGWTAPVAAVAGTISIGDVLVWTSTGYVKATSANRTTYGKPDGVAATAGDSANPVTVIPLGPVPATITNLGNGAAGPVRVSTAGILERVATPSSSDDVVGYCFTDGRAFLVCGGAITHRVFVDSGGGGSTPTGTGFRHVTAGVEDAASAKVNLAAAADVTGTLGVGNGGTGITSLAAGIATWLGTPSGANLAAALTSALPDTKGGTGLTALAAGIATFLGTPSGANLASALTSALPDTKGGTGLTALAAGIATFLGTPSGANLAAALTTALPDTKGGTGLTALGAGVATMLGTFSSANIKTACTDETGTGGALVFATAPTLATPTFTGTAVTTGLRYTGTTSNNGTGTLNDVSLGGNRKVRFTNAVGPTINGFDSTGVADGEKLMVIVDIAAGTVAVASEAAGSLAANRIHTAFGTSLSLNAGTYLELMYDGANSRWIEPAGNAV